LPGATKNTGDSALLRLIGIHVLPESSVYTDELNGYDRVKNIRAEDGGSANYQHRPGHEIQADVGTITDSGSA